MNVGNKILVCAIPLSALPALFVGLGWTIGLSNAALLLLLCLGLTVAAVGLLIFSNKLTTPVHTLIAGIHQLRSGNLETHVPITTTDEIGLLTGAFNAMAAQLRKLIGELEERNQQLRLEIAERLEAQDALKASEEKFRGIVDNSQEGIFQTTPQGRMLGVNPAMARIFGYGSPDEMILELTNLSRQVYCHPEDRTRFLHLLRTQGHVTSWEVQLRRRDGTPIWVLTSARLVNNQEAGSEYIEGILTDITQRKAMEEELSMLNKNLEQLVEERTEALLQQRFELEVLNQRLVEADETKSRLLNTVSHDLRTPLTSILGFAKIVTKDFQGTFAPLASDNRQLAKKADRINDNLGIMLSESIRLTRLINDFLNLSKIESGRLEWQDTAVRLADVVSSSVNAVRGELEHKPDLELTVDVAHDVPEFTADPDRIIQVLVNLLGNAVKFTETGRVSLKAFMTAPDLLRIEVSDTGEGIASDELESIFDVFNQASKENTLKERPPGTGLGLAICRQIVEHYEGRIWATSELGRGSVFIVELPVQ